MDRFQELKLKGWINLTSDERVEYQRLKEKAANPNAVNIRRYQELPPPIVEYLEQNYGSWLRYFEIGQEWKEDFGGYGIYIKVPKEFSTEYKKEKITVYDNVLKQPKKDKDGKVLYRELITEDVRWKPINNMDDVKKWLGMVKEHIINNAYRKGIRLPNTNTKLEETHETIEDYQKAIHS